MKKITSIKHALLAAFALLGLAFAAPVAQAAPFSSITFGFSGNTVTSINITNPLVFNATTSYNYYAVQIRLYDAYSPSVATGFATTTAANFSATVGGTPVSLTSVNPSSRSDLGFGSGGDLLAYFQGSTNFNFTSGTSVTFSGGGTVTGDMVVPTSGTYTAYLVSQADGSLLSAPLTVVVTGVSAVPEPSTYALILGACGLGFVAVRRFRRR